MEQKRIEWIDGLKGLSCIFIVLHHFILGYYPAAYHGTDGFSHFSSGIDIAFSQSPFAVFTIGDFWVTIFCMISGIVIANQVWKMREDKQFSKALLKRYPRLVLPVFFVSVIVFLMLQIGLFYNVQASSMTHSEWLSMFYLDKSSVPELFLDSFVDTWFVGMRLVYSNAFWMLNDLFAGSFLAYILAYMGKELKKRMALVYIFVSILYLSINSRMADFALGVLAAFLFIMIKDSMAEKKKIYLAIGIVLLIVGLLLGAYPVAVEPTNGYRFLSVIENIYAGRLVAYRFYHKIAAFCLLMGIEMVSGVKKVLAVKPCLFLGQISYSVYLIHIPVLFSLTAFLFVKLQTVFTGYNLRAFVCLVISLFAIVLLAWLYYRFVEKQCVRFTNWLIEWILK